MIYYNNSQFSADIAGLFYTNNEWTHPTTSIDTYEIILVTNGNVYIQEDGIKYYLKHNDLLVLDANKTHGGFKTSSGVTSFFWIHFKTSDISKLPKLEKIVPNFIESHLFKEYAHLHALPNYPSELLDIALLGLIGRISGYNNLSISHDSAKLANEVYAYIKNNANPNLTTKEISNHFKYSPEYLTRIIQKHYGKGIKKAINDTIINIANGLLANTNYSTNTIAINLGFESDNLFLKFYKYHTGLTPSNYRNIYVKTLINNK